MSQELEGSTFDLLQTAGGVVLDVGPGTGEMLCRLNPELIKKAYGVEPAVDMHQALQKNIDKNGLDGKYDILACGAEPATLIPALDKKGLLKTEGQSREGVFDAILCIRVLCGVPNQQETVNELYNLLKPGGRLIVCEHIASPWPKFGSIVGYILQKFWILAGWNLLMGGCKLNRDTVRALETAGGVNGWKKFDIVYCNPWDPIPFIAGELVKS
jgi:SAM-dependent methyltransferase